MLEFIRKHQKWMLVFVILLIVPSFVFLGVFDYQGMMSNDKPLAQIKEQKVTRDQFNAEWRDRLNQVRLQAGNDFDISQVDVPENRRAFLNQLINSRVMHEAVVGKHYSATDEMVTQAIYSDPQFHVDGRFNVDTYRQFLQRVGIDSTMYEGSIRYSLALEQVAEPAKRSLTVAKPIEAAVLDALLEERQVRLRLFEASTYYASNAASDAEAKAWYDDNKASLEIPDQVDAQYILLNEEAAVNAVAIPSQSELEQYYESNMARFTRAERRTINHIQLNLPANASAEQVTEVEQKANSIIEEAAADASKFADLAREHSDDVGTKQLGGQLGVLTRGDIPSFDSVAFTPSEPGVYGPVRIDNALHIVQVAAIEAGEVRSFEELRDDLIREVRLQVASDRFADLSSELVRLANDASQNLESISSALELPIKTQEGVTLAGVVHDSIPQEGAIIFANHPQAREALFSHEVLEQGRTSGVIELSPTELLVVQPTNFQAAHIPSFEDAEADVLAAVRTEKSLAQAKLEAENVAEALTKGEITALTDFEESMTVSRLTGNLPTTMIDTIMAAPVDNLPNHTTFWVPQGYVVARIEGVNEPDDELKGGLQLQVEQLLLTGPQLELEKQLLNSLREGMKVKIFDESEAVINDTGM